MQLIMRKSDLLFPSLGIASLLLLLTVVDTWIRGKNLEPHLERVATQVRDLELTDLSLFTEARYTRHLSQADYHTAFQDHPFAIEHFPSGSLVVPPPHMLSADYESISPQAEISD